ncbi:L,D-transpeptidase family protein [Altererythrobacter sp. MF3-039]|uniref:L,D-transpeptidase family protein n=1 Tax=Altererythrobacter sp. MF3-039 TaxID=3252901 RepID=UPI00390C6CE9
MKNYLSLSLILGLSVAAAPLAAQNAAPQDLLSQAEGESEERTEMDVPTSQAEGVEQAFAGTEFVSEPVMQDLSPPVAEWSIDAAGQLAFALETVDREGLNPADYEIAALRAAVIAGPSPQLDEIASRNFIWLVEDMRDGRTPMSSRKQWFVVDPDPDRYRSRDLLAQVSQTGDVVDALNLVRPTHPDYQRLVEALADTPQAEAGRRKLIMANLDRWRWLPRDLGNQYLLTNVPEFQLRLTVNDKIISTYRTIVGKPGRNATPQLAEIVEGVVFNPTWTVPQSIVKGEGLGQKVLNNPKWAQSQGYKATKGAGGWIGVVQQPGPTNSLGMMKLDMPNPHAIFLHDTPSRHLFANDMRALSHGCIRTERALELAITMAIVGKGATKEEAIEIVTSGDYTKVPMQREFPVYITYFTMASDIDGELRTFKDIYGRDEPVLAALDQPRESNRARKTSEEVVEIIDDLQTT